MNTSTLTSARLNFRPRTVPIKLSIKRSSFRNSCYGGGGGRAKMGCPGKRKHGLQPAVPGGSILTHSLVLPQLAQGSLKEIHFATI